MPTNNTFLNRILGSLQGKTVQAYPPGQYTDNNLLGQIAATLLAAVGGSSSTSWTDITATPTTLAGFGITDAMNRVSVPASASATGSLGQFASDATFLYICVGTNSWRRISTTTF